MGDVAEAVQRACFAGGVVVCAVKGQGGLAVFAGLFVVAEAGVEPADAVQGSCFPHRVVQEAAEGQGVEGVFQGLLVVALLFVGPGQDGVGVGLGGFVALVFG